MADVDDAIADARDAVMAETAYSSGATGGLKRQRSSSWSDDDRPPKQAKEEKSNEVSRLAERALQRALQREL